MRFIKVWSLFIHCILSQFFKSSASTPIVKVISNDSSRVVLQCESAGWYPEPELLWLDGEGNLLSAGPTETLRGPDDLYTVSSRVTVEKRHSNNITCRVQQRNTNQSRETHKHVPGVILDSIIPPLHIVIIVGLYCFLAFSIVCLQSVETKTACRREGNHTTAESRIRDILNVQTDLRSLPGHKL
ncbi:unnamed protein product [Oreochromis niloticus]|nr:unnamed protein product [Mustela putorius furo]